MDRGRRAVVAHRAQVVDHRVVRLERDSIAEYERHIKLYLGNLTTYQQHMEHVRAMEHLSAGDAAYLRATLAIGDERASSPTLAMSYDASSGPNMPDCSVVWLAPVPRSRAGRSAETTIRPTPAWMASRTAGCRFATAVPEVVTTAARVDPVA